MPGPLYIRATGMVSAVGLSAAASCAAIRAGVSPFQELPYRDNERRPLVGAQVPVLPWGLTRRERLAELLALAVADATRALPPERSEQVALLVGTAESTRPGAGSSSQLLHDAQSRLQRRFHSRWSSLFPEGHTAGIQSLARARELLETTHLDACLVCGVDSFLDAPSLQWLADQLRLKTMDNSDGVIPGEAAVCLWIERSASARTVATTSLHGLGFARESATVLSDEPLRGRGLAQACSQALSEAGLEMKDIDLRLSDTAGDTYGFKEQSLMLARLLRETRESLPLWLVAESLGETGAAAGLCQLVMVDQAFRRGYAPGPRALCSTSSVHGNRAAVVALHFGRMSAARNEQRPTGLRR